MKKEGKVTNISGKYNAAVERNENVLGAKIAEARKQMRWNQAALTEILKEYGVSLSTGAVGKWETGETVPSAYQFLAVCAALGMEDSLSFYHRDHSPELNEEGMRKVREYKEDLISSGRYSPRTEETFPAAPAVLCEMPVAYLAAAAGTGNWLDDNEAYEMMSFPEDEIPKGAELGIRISGDSMEPAYHDGQIVWVKKCSELNVGDVGIFLYDGKAFIKQYGEQEPEKEFLDEYTDHYGTVHKQPVLYSCNAAKYSPIVINPYSTFRICGRVLG